MLVNIKFKTRKDSVIGILPLFVVLLIIVSFAMIVTVPVILATPGEWEKSQGIVWSGAGLWSALVVLTGIFNAVPA
jgi:photosystem II core protein PsbZ